MSYLNYLVWIPQIITGLRLLAGPVVIYCLLHSWYGTAIFLCILAGVSDWLDGFLARFLKCETSFGRIFDPIADKVFVSCLFLYNLFMYSSFFWLAIVIIARDIAILLGAYLLRKNNPNLELPPLWISKINTAQVMLLGVLVIILHWCFSKDILFIMNHFNLIDFDKHPTWAEIYEQSHFIGRLLLIGSLCLFYGSFCTTFISGAFYVRFFQKFYRSS